MDAECFQPHQVLGDYRQYQLLAEHERQLQTQQLPQQQQQGVQDASEASSMDQIDPSTVNPDVWAAARLLGDKGVQLIRIYRELEQCRDAALHHVTLNSSLRTLTASQQQRQHGMGGSYGAPGGKSSAAAAADACGAIQVDAPGSAVGQLLSKPTVMDTIKQSHDARVMSAWEAQQAQWQAQARHLAALLGQHSGQLALTTAGPDWRSKQELLSALEVAVPQAALAQHKANRASVFDTGNADGHDGDRGSIQDGGPVGSVACTGGNWMSSLRNANERLLQVGNIFSGLFLSVRNTPTVAAAGLTAISTPADDAFSPVIPCVLGETHNLTHSTAQRDGSGGFGGSTGSSSVGRSPVTKRSVSQRQKWVKEPYLQDKLTAGAAARKALQPQPPDTTQLAVTGWSIEAALAASPLTCKPVGLADVERRLAVAAPSLFLEYQAAQQREAAKAAAAAAAEAAAAKRAAARAAASQLPHPGPHLEASASHLALTYTIPTHRGTAELSTPRPDTSWAAIHSSAGGDASEAAAAAAGPVAKLTLVSTGTAAVYYCWVPQGRQRLPVAAAAAAAGGEEGCSEQDAVAGVSGDGGPLFTMPDRQGVILPGESKTFRFTFSAPAPGVYHEAWSCFTHPPLEPHVDRSRRRGEPLPLHLQGTAVPDGDSPGPVLVAAGHIKARIEQNTRDTQIQAVLNIILDRAAQTAAEHAKAGLQQRQGHQGAGDYDAAVAAKWAAANPPDSCGCRSSSSGCDGPLQQQQGDGHAQLAERSPADSDAAAAAVPGRGVRVCVHYYSPRVHASLSDVYSQARALLAPPPPPVDPPKKGTASVGGPKSKSKEVVPPDPPELHLPEAWDCSIGGLRGLLGNLASATPQPHKRAGLVLCQQLEVALRQAAVPDCDSQMVEAAARRCLLSLADAVEGSAAALALPPSTEHSSVGGAGGRGTHRGSKGGGDTARHGSTGGGAEGAAVGAAHARTSSISGGSGGAAKGKAGAQQQQQQQQQGVGGGVLSQQLSDAVWGDVSGALSCFEGVLGQFHGSAVEAVQVQAGLFGAADSYENVAWRAFACSRKQQQLGLT